MLTPTWMKRGKRGAPALLLAIAFLTFTSAAANAAITFGPPVNMESPVNHEGSNFASSISADGLSLYYVDTRSGGFNIHVSTRATLQSPFGASLPLPGAVNTTGHHELFPSVTADGLELYFSERLTPPFPQGALRPGGVGGGDIWRATRVSTAETFGEPVNLGAPLNSVDLDGTPRISGDGLTLLFSSARPGGSGSSDVWMANRPTRSDPFGSPINLGPNVNSPSDDGAARPAPDGLALFFGSSRPGGFGNFDLWMSTRSSLSELFGPPVNLGSTINGPQNETAPDISPDYSTLYFTSADRPGGLGATDIWQAPILPLPTWNVDANGNWSLAGNWVGAVPNAAGARAVFGGIIGEPRTVTLDVLVTLGRLDFDSTNAYTIAGANPLTFDVTSGSAQVNVVRGSHTIGAAVTLTDNTVISVSPADSSLSLNGGVNTAGVNVAKTGTGTLAVNRIQAAGLSINAGTVQITPDPGAQGPGPSVLGGLAIAGGAAPTATLDVTNGAAVIDYTGASPAATIRRQIVAGRGGPGLGASWNGRGITSSAAAAANATKPESRSIGYAENASLPLGPYTSFRGQAVDETSLLMAFTRTGDANLDGVVDDEDVTIVGATYAPGISQPDWALGDFDYNGFVDDDDVTLLGVFYDPSATPIAGALSAVSSQAAAVPEPASLVLLASAFGVMLVALRLTARRRGNA